MNEKLLTHARGWLSRLLLLFALILMGAQVSWAVDVTGNLTRGGSAQSISEAGTYYYTIACTRSTRYDAIVYSATDEMELYSDTSCTTKVACNEFKNVSLGGTTGKSVAYFTQVKDSTFCVKLTTQGSSSIKWQTATTQYLNPEMDTPYTFVTFPTQCVFAYTPASSGTIIAKQTFPENTDCSSLGYSWWASIKEATTTMSVEPEVSGNVVTYNVPATGSTAYVFWGTWASASNWTSSLLPMTVEFSFVESKSFTELTLDASVAIDAAGEYYYSYTPAADSTYAFVCNSADAIKLYSDATCTTEVSFKEEDNGDGTKSVIFTGAAGTTYYAVMTAAAASSIKVTVYDNTITITAIELDTDVATNAGKNYYSVDVSSVITKYGQVVVVADATVVPYSDEAFTAAIDYDTFTGEDGKTYIRFAASSATYYLMVTGSATINVTAATWKDSPSVVIPIELNTLYTQPGYTTTNYSFTTTKAEKCYIRYTGAYKEPSVSGVTLQLPNATGFISGDADGCNTERYFTAEAGKTYTLTINNYLNSTACKFKVFMESDNPLDTVSVSPAVGTVYSVTGGSVPGRLSVVFSKNVDVEGTTLTCGTASVSLTREDNIKTSLVYDDVAAAIQSLLSAGTAKAGDAFTITITGIAASDNAEDIFGTDGTLVLNYIMPEAAMELTSSTMPEKFLPLWESGDETGVATMTFNKNINTTSTPTATISCGSKDKDADGGYYEETVPVTINADGKSLTIDFTGKSRTYSDMFPNYDVDAALADESLASSFQNISLKVSNIKDVDGAYCYTGSTAHTGSFSYTIPYESTTVSEVTIISDFIPAPESDLAEKDYLEIWFNNASYVEYTGVTFTYDGTDGQESTTVEKANCTITEDTEENTVTIKVAVPEAVKTAKNVTVTLADISYKNGASGAITAQYNLVDDSEFSITMLKPDPSVAWTTLNANDTIKVKPTHFSEIGYMNYAIYDAATGECVKASAENMEKDATNEVAIYEVFGDYTFYEGHTYNIIFDAWGSEADKRAGTNHIGTDTIVISGASEEYKFSTVKFVSIDPAESDDYVIDSTDKNTFVVTFDGLVWLDPTQTNIHDESGTSVSFASITATGTDAETVDGKTYSTVWTLVVPASYIQRSDVTAVGFGVKAYDKEGLLVEGNTGELAESYLDFEYACCAGAPDFTIDPVGGSTVTSLKEFTVSYSEGICASWSVAAKKIQLLDASGNVVAYATSTEQIIPDEEANNWSYVPTSVKVILNTEITASGEYTLSFPYKYFILGEDMSAQNSKPATFKYTIAGASTGATADLTPSAADPADGNTVESLEAIHLTFGENVVVNSNVTNPVVAVASDGTTYTGTVYVDPLDTKSVYVEFDPAITTDGTYTITIAEGVIGNSEYETSGYTSGNCNPALTYSYTVGETEIPAEYAVTADPADGSTVESLSKIKLTWEKQEYANDSYNNGDIEVKNAAGEVVTTCTTDYVDWSITNALYLTLKSEITTAGTYTVSIPAARFNFGELGDTDAPAYTLTYTIGGTVKNEGLVADPADGSTVESLTEIKLTWTNAEEAEDTYESTLPITVTNAAGEVVTRGECYIYDGDDANVLHLVFYDEVTEEGTYTVTIPAGRMLLDGTAAPAYSLTYTVGDPTGIGSVITDENGRYNVYSISGVQVKSADSKSALKTLKPGLYIINGKKIVVR